MIMVRKALPGEGAKVAEQIRASLSRSIEGLTIWHCRHVDRWVEMRIAAPGGSAFYVASDESTGLVGAAEFRTIDGTVFLNQIGVIASRQGERIGGRLLAAGLRDLCRSGASASLALDVETGNKRAAAWYRRLGLAPVARTYWTVTGLRPDGVAPVSRPRLDAGRARTREIRFLAVSGQWRETETTPWAASETVCSASHRRRLGATRRSTPPSDGSMRAGESCLSVTHRLRVFSRSERPSA